MTGPVDPAEKETGRFLAHWSLVNLNSWTVKSPVRIRVFFLWKGRGQEEVNTVVGLAGVDLHCLPCDIIGTRSQFQMA